MSEMILPGTYIEVRPEGLITPGRVSINTVGMLGTAARGAVNKPTLLSSYTEARETFGEYDAWDPDNQGQLLTLMRGLELAFMHGASQVLALRVADGAQAASFMLASAGGACCKLEANSPGAWGNELEVKVDDAPSHSFVSDEEHTGGGPVVLNYKPVVPSGRNRVSVFVDATQRTRAFNIVYAPDAAAPGTVQINPATGALTFAAADTPAAADTVFASYVVDKSVSVRVTLRHGLTEEIYIVASGNDLAADINNSSALAIAEADATNGGEPPNKLTDFMLFGTGTNTRGDNGTTNVDASEYQTGLDLLLNEDAHIIVAAGQSHKDFGAQLANHCKAASDDVNKRERIAVTGSALKEAFDDIRGHMLDSDRVVFVAPGIEAIDAANNGKRVVLPGSYTATAVAGLMSSYPPHVSLTNKTLPVVGLEELYTNAELSQLVQNHVLAIHKKQAFKILKGITTSSNSAWEQITTRRIVDYAKVGVRKAADPYIGLLNNERVRGALRATINSFLAEMVEDEQLTRYRLEVLATREEERKGIARVTIVLRPVFSIDFIKVTMFLE